MLSVIVSYTTLTPLKSTVIQCASEKASPN